MFGKPNHDKQLVKKLLNGDEAAFDQFYQEYFDRLYRFVLVRCSGQTHFAEDIVQSALCKAIDKLTSYRAEAPLYSWLCTFCRYELSAFYRKSNRQPVLIDDNPQFKAEIESLSISLQQEPENSYLQQELNKFVHLTLDSIPTKYAFVIEKKYIQGLSVKEIAQHLQTSVKSVESMLSRARPVFEDIFLSLFEAHHTEADQQ